MGAMRLSNAASAAMKLANWQMPREWRVRIVQLREQLEAARAALKPEGPARLEGEGDRTP
jgi:two-component system sensor histidine kinase RpfC